MPRLRVPPDLYTIDLTGRAWRNEASAALNWFATV
jgi:hypothetical protein